MKRKITAIDLFSGAGGLTQGLKNAGFNVIAAIELNPTAAATYKANHHKVKLFNSDIKSVTCESLTNKLGLEKGELDLLAGCPPCQGFSSHTTRNKATSKSDKRNDLVLEFLRFVEGLLPKTIMLENVPALAKDWRATVVREQLASLGYVIADNFAAIEDAADYGVPQRRKRLLLKASRLGTIDNPIKVPERTTVRQTIGSLAQPGYGEDVLHNLPERRSEKVQQIISKIPKNGGSRTDLPEELWLECHKKSPGSYADVYGRMEWDDVAPTITGGCHNPSKGRFLHPEQDRAITLREAALLQTFPPDYKFPITKNKDDVALLIGNALPPKLIEAHAKQYIQHLRRNA